MKKFIPVVAAVVLFTASTAVMAFTKPVTVAKVRGNTLTFTASVNKVSDLTHHYVSLKSGQLPYKVIRISCAGNLTVLHFANPGPTMREAGLTSHDPVSFRWYKQQNTNIKAKQYCPLH